MAGSVFLKSTQISCCQSREVGYIDGMDAEMENPGGQAILGDVVMLEALASGCGGVSARQSVSPSLILLPCFGSAIDSSPEFPLVEGRYGCDRSIFRVENCSIPAFHCRLTS